MRRQEKQLSDEQSPALLRRGELGVLCLVADGAYGVPLNYAPDENDASWPDLLLYCAPQGAKPDVIEKNPKSASPWWWKLARRLPCRFV